MPSPEQSCFTDDGPIIHPVQFLTVSSDHDATDDLKLFSDNAGLDAFLDTGNSQNYSCRFISICQSYSWSPLQVTSHMLSKIIDSHGFSPSVYDLASCFYRRNLDLEDSFCIPLMPSFHGSWTEVLYTIRYPEFKQNQDEWVIRQSGLCHRFNAETRQSIFLLFSPMPDSKAHRSLCEYLTARANRVNTWFALHHVLLETHLPSWRAYAKFCETEFLPIANATFSTYIDEPLRVGYDQLNILSGLEARCLKMASLLENTIELIEELVGFVQSSSDIAGVQVGQTTSHHHHHHQQQQQQHRTPHSLVTSLKNHNHRCAAYARTANFLRQRVDGTTRLLASTLSFRDQVIAKEQNGNMLLLNKSAVFITTLTLIYAPASFVATFFGMNFFAMDQANSRIICTAMIWMYVIATFALTTVTVVFYYWLLRHDSVLFWRLAPKVHASADWKALMRRFTKLDHPVDVELRHFDS